jgi:hypothetical protein
MPKACFSPTTPCYSFPVLTTSMQTLAGVLGILQPTKGAGERSGPTLHIRSLGGTLLDTRMATPSSCLLWKTSHRQSRQAVDDISGLTDSPGGNLIRPPPSPTHVASFSMQQPPKVLHLQDLDLDSIMVKQSTFSTFQIPYKQIAHKTSEN